MRTLIACLFGLALATPATAALNKNPFNDQLLKLSLTDRNAALRRAVTETQRCGRLSKSVSRGLYGNLGFWVVRCVPGGDYGVFLGPDASIQVRTCAEMPGLKLPACGKLD